MSVEMKVPQVGESITEVTIASWLKKDGEQVKMDEVIAELESDKATFELTAEASGVLKIKVEEGETVEIGATLCEIEEGEAKKEESKPENKEASTDKKEGSAETEVKKSAGGKSEIIEMRVPTVGESITEVVISTWLKADGDTVKLDEIIAEVDSDKATFELPAEATGKLQIIAQEGDTLEVGGLICKIEVTEDAASDSQPESSSKESSEKESAEDNKSSHADGHPSPAAAKILAEKGISPEAVKGTGPGGRITKEDALSAEKSKPEASSKKEESKPASKEASAPAPSGDRNQNRQKMTNLRKTIARRLVSVKNETAMLTTFNEVDMKPIMDIRKKYKDSFKEKYEVNLGFMSFFTKAVCQALLEWPAVNAQIDGEEIVYNEFCDVSIAVSTPRGLVVPVIRNAEQMSFQQIEKEILRLAGKARDGKLSIEEMTGGTFTITNGGVFGSLLSTPIINAPQAAILGMHNIVERAMVVDGQVVVRPMMYVALSYDHRIIDGRESVSFLVRVKQLLEDPARLLLGV
ncbi:2-oxoglutarate dehydrogenase complex dihydrolipoyllysine-residue succinyltransferase [Fulvivirgaceae bacterium LMO-SS25]